MHSDFMHRYEDFHCYGVCSACALRPHASGMKTFTVMVSVVRVHSDLMHQMDHVNYEVIECQEWDCVQHKIPERDESV